jgi:hypothetical protein
MTSLVWHSSMLVNLVLALSVWVSSSIPDLEVALSCVCVRVCVCVLQSLHLISLYTSLYFSRNNIYYIFSSNDPGIYNIKMYYKGKSDPIYERNMQLEDLLEMQNQSDPVIDMEGFVLLSVRRTLLLMNRLFIKGDTPHRGSIQRRLSLSISSTSNVKI